MLKSLFDIMRQLFGYADDTKKNTTDIKDLQADRETTNITIRQIISDADTDRRLADKDRDIASRDRQILLMNVAAAL